MKRKEIIAEIRNKLTLAKTILESLSADKKISKDLIKIALRDFNKAVELIGEEQFK